MPGHTLMFQGTASHVGKSVITAAACRWLARQGFRVAPFKAQNMSLNSAVAADGGEIGRSQAFQAEACGIPSETAMNPVLLKPMAGGRCQVILRGRPHRITDGPGDRDDARLGLEVAANCLRDLRARFDVVVLEGMGSPAEINLAGRDMANMAIAGLVEAPGVLVGDIERGGVFAALAGTLELLATEERNRVRGLLINKYYGDRSILTPGADQLQSRYGVPTLGVLPWLRDLRVDEEDAVALESNGRPEATGEVDVLVPRLPGISNFTDVAPLAEEPGVRVRFVELVREWGAPHLVVLPGSRSVAADLHWLRDRGLAARLQGFARDGGRVIGICGGYQMLGRTVLDPSRIESDEPAVDGLGLLNVETTLAPEKVLARVRAVSAVPGLERAELTGYEIHHGETRRLSALSPALRVTRCEGDGDSDPGAADASGRIFGCYLHGLFDSREFRHALLRSLGWAGASGEPIKDARFDRLADWFEQHVDTQRVLEMIRESPCIG
ncbi:MAG: cobyric acid synthase [Actinomycetota bacterium]